MQLTAFLLITLAPAALARGAKRQATGDAAFSSAAGQLISLYIPQSVASAIYSAATAASVTGDPNAIVASALTATATPTWFSAVPTEYQPNINSLDSAISELRGAAATGIPGAPRITTLTDSAGSAVVSTVPGSSVVTSTAALTGAAASSASASLSSALSEASSALSSLSSSLAAVASSLTASTSSATSSAATSRATSSQAVTSSVAGEGTSSAFAAPTQVPMAAAGVLGLVGVVLAL